jgi:hypothetical protein
MKKIILFILVITQISFITAQSLVITGDTMFAGDPNIQIDHHLVVKNTSANPITVKCQKTNLTLPTGAESYYCFAGNCYGATTTTSTSSAILAAGQQISFNNFPADVDAHTGYYDAFGASGIAEVQYCFYDVNDTSDETCVTITYETTTNTAIDDFQPLTKLGDFYPNPASEMVYFTFNGNAATLKLIDILGNNVKEILLSQEGIQKLDLSDMNKGIYFGNLIVNDEVVSIKKLIVK